MTPPNLVVHDTAMCKQQKRKDFLDRFTTLLIKIAQQEAELDVAQESDDYLNMLDAKEQNDE